MRRLAPVAFAGLLAAGCGGADPASRPPESQRMAATTPPARDTAAPASTPDAPRPRTAAVSVKTIATGLRVPWGIAFLPGGDALVAERATGRILRVPPGGGRKRVVMRVPEVDSTAGEGGLLGLAISPRYRRDRLVYAYYTTARDNRIARFRLGGRPRPVLAGLQRAGIHNGGRIAFGPDGRLYAGVGDAADPAVAQRRGALNGKILRMEPNGAVPADNPFSGSLVYSLGHRNVQGLAWDAQGRMWASEFGQSRFDELNRIRPGRNYGWPEVEGRAGTRGGRFTNPAVTWPTSEASPSGIAIVGRRLYMAALRGEGLWRVPLHGNRAGRPRLRYGGRFGRLRTVVRAPSGGLWIATSNRDGRGTPRPGDDRIVRVPAS